MNGSGEAVGGLVKSRFEFFAARDFSRAWPAMERSPALASRQLRRLLLTEKSIIFNGLQLKVKRQVTIFLKQECLLKIITCHPRREPLLLQSAAPDKRGLWK